MAHEREVCEMSARVIGIIKYYYDNAKSSQRKALMGSEIKTIAKWFVLSKIEEKVIIERVMKPIEVELIHRYGSELGSQLNAEFMEAFCEPSPSKQR